LYLQNGNLDNMDTTILLTDTQRIFLKSLMNNDTALAFIQTRRDGDGGNRSDPKQFVGIILDRETYNSDDSNILNAYMGYYKEYKKSLVTTNLTFFEWLELIKSEDRYEGLLDLSTDYGGDQKLRLQADLEIRKLQSRYSEYLSN